MISRSGKLNVMTSIHTPAELGAALRGARKNLGLTQPPGVFDGTRLGLPRDGTPSAHILKPAIRSLQDPVIHAGFFLALARAMPLQTSTLQIQGIRDPSPLLV